MNEIKNKSIVIVGLGAVGAVYATALYDHSFPVRIAVDSERLKRYHENPFIFNGKRYDFDYFTPSTGGATAELIIIATKSGGYSDALTLIHPIVGPATQIMPLLNGITSEALAAEIYGWEHVVYSYFIGHTASRIDRSATQDGRYVTVFGDQTNDPAQLSLRITAIKTLFDATGIRYRIDPDMLSSLWQKFVINIGLNQVTALMRKPYGALQSDATAVEYTRSLMGEAAAVAMKIGIRDAEFMVEKGVETLSKMAPEDSSSMLQDVMAHRPTEIDMFAGEVCRLGKQHGVQTPLNCELLSKLK